MVLPTKKINKKKCYLRGSLVLTKIRLPLALLFYDYKPRGPPYMLNRFLLNSFNDEIISLAGEPQHYGYFVAKRNFLLEDGTSLSVVGHPGGGAGYTSGFFYSPSLDISISILANSNLEYARREGGCSEYGTGDCIGWGLFKAYAP